MNLSFYEIALGYDDAIEKTKELVKKARLELKAAKESNDTNLCRYLRYKLAVYYEEIREMKDTSAYLKSYYDELPARETEAAG